MMELLESLYNSIAISLLLFTLPGSFNLVMYTLHGLCSPKPLYVATKFKSLKLAVLIPAHNEAENIHATIASLHACQGQFSSFTVVVIADNCVDETALVARQLGCRVIERVNNNQRGKGYALAYAFEQLESELFDAYIIVDADTKVEPNFIAAMERPLQSGAQGAQCRYIVDPEQKGLRPTLMAIAFMLFNVLRARARSHAGQSVGIMGNGFALTRKSLKQVPYDARSIVEDLEHHLDMVRAGHRIDYVDDTKVWSAMPSNHDSAAPQRARWEGGRLYLMQSRTSQLISEILRGKHQLWEPLMELLTLPLSYHTMLLIPALLSTVWWVKAMGVAGLAIIFIYVTAGMIIGEANQKHLKALLSAPFYILWKLAMTPRIMRSATPNSTWQRTARDRSASASTPPQPSRFSRSKTPIAHHHNDLDPIEWENEETEMRESQDVMARKKNRSSIHEEKTEVINEINEEATEFFDNLDDEKTEMFDNIGHEETELPNTTTHGDHQKNKQDKGAPKRG